MLSAAKNYLIRGAFKPVHMGNWIRGLYMQRYLSRMVRTQPQDILDAASGNGRHVIILSKLYPNAVIEGMDINSFKEWEKLSGPLHRFNIQNLEELNEHEKRDLIVSIDTIEHIKGNERVLKAFYEALRPGGHLYLHVPCESDEIFIFPRRWFSAFYEWAEDEHVGEMRKLSDLTRIMQQIGYEICLARNTFTLFGHLAWEIEFLLQHKGVWGRRFNIIFSPIYKLLGLFDVWFQVFGGNNLVIARRSK